MWGKGSSDRIVGSRERTRPWNSPRTRQQRQGRISEELDISTELGLPMASLGPQKSFKWKLTASGGKKKQVQREKKPHLIISQFPGFKRHLTEV